MQFYELFHLPLSNMRSDEYSWSRDRKPANVAYKWHFFDIHSTNISQIANLNAAGERAPNSAHSMYWSCHSTIRTHILNWSQSCRNRKFGTMIRFQLGQIPAVLCPGRVTPRQDKCGSGLWPVLESNRTEPPVKTRTAGGLPGPVANTTQAYLVWWV